MLLNRDIRCGGTYDEHLLKLLWSETKSFRITALQKIERQPRWYRDISLLVRRFFIGGRK